MTRLSFAEMPRVEISDNDFYDSSKTWIHIGNQEDLVAAMEESQRAHIYVSPVFFSVRDGTFITGDDAKLWRRVCAWRSKWRTFCRLCQPWVWIPMFFK